ncbi:hypothetical protein EAG_10976 [Camponotus floridanus]|uniref:CASP8-associated protein 2 n=1 Tax=Camponotus floridanus TaxID=104421 RepID=E2AJ42_CAMFO|nr:CASP8-associated protein 2 [Camponotus floridanus]XP_011258984.1 CASP8-associated protein 2 [Camponotus floridanus]EFN66482.1 hypothetical protein EAG_10976 [Camponotus floridanus]
MEDDIDIYADLPSFNFNLDKNDQPCNCEKLKKELSSLKSELENIQKIKENLEKNISSLLKTARGEIARKDKMISDLRKRLDDATFRRNNKGESRDFFYKSSHQQHTIVEKYEDAPLIHSQEDETVSHETEFHNEHKNEKLEYDDQQPTVFAERLYKRIKDEKENTKQKTLLNFDVEIKKKIAEENIMESDKENGSQSNINNGNESNTITRHSDSENLCTKNSGKRMNEEDYTHESKRLKINEDKIDYDSIVQYELKDDLAQYEMKAKFEDRLNAVHSLKEEISLDKRRAASEHQDTSKQSRDCINGWKREDKSSSRIASTSNHVSEELHNGYKKNVYSSRYSSRRSYSRSRSDYESSSDHRPRERSNRTYRKYDDYKYDNQYRTKGRRDYRLKRDYESIENENKTRHRSRERGNVAWIKSRHSLSDVEDKERSNSYMNKKYENRRIKKTTENVSCNKDVQEKDKIAMEIDSRASSSSTIVNNTMNHGAKKTTEQDKIKNKSNRTNHVDSIESTSIYIATKDSSNLEEGEIVDSPEKKSDLTKISKNHEVENDTKIVLMEDVKDKDVPMIVSVTEDKSTTLHDDIITAKQLNNMTDISTKEVEAESCLVQTIKKDPEDTAELNPDKSDAIVDDVQNRDNVEDICKSQCNENLTDSTTCTIGMIEQVCEFQCNEDLTNSTTYTTGPINRICNSNVDDDDKNRVKKESKISVTETAIKIEEMADTNTESTVEVRKIDKPNVENAINKDKGNNSNIESPVLIAETNNSDNNIRKIDDKELKNSTAETVAGKVEVALNCDIKSKDAPQIPSKISRQTSGKSSEMNHLCLSDHNYVQDPSPVNASESNVVRDSSMSPRHCQTVPEVATIKETKPEKEIDVSLTVDIKKTMSSTVKNKKNQFNKSVVISRRRRAVMLSDSNASMTVLMNTKTSSNVISNSSNESILKPRACKASRACK